MSIENINYAELCAETTDIIELADEQLEAVAGGAVQASTSKEPESPNLFGWKVPTPHSPHPQQDHPTKRTADILQSGMDGENVGKFSRPFERVFSRIFTVARIP